MLRIRCQHGHFIFEEQAAGQLSAFMSVFGLDLVAKENYYTFDLLSDAPRFSIKGADYLGLTAVVSFEGEPWEVMRQNGFVYDFTADELVPIESITQTADLFQAANYFLSNGLILPGSITDDGSRVTDYSAWYLFDTTKFKYSEVRFE